MNDWQEAWRAAQLLSTDERRRLKYLEQQTARLYQLLNRGDNWAALAALADNLLAHETLEGEQVEEILTQWLQ